MDVDRQSFIIYKNFYEPIKHLNNTDLGKLFRAIFEYNLAEKNVNGYVVPPEVKIPFEFFRNQFNLDEAKWMKRVNASRENGMKGGRPPQPKEPTGFPDNQDEPRKGDTVTDTVTVTVTETENETEKDLKEIQKKKFETWWKYWRAKSRDNPGTKNQAEKYWKELNKKLSAEQIQKATDIYLKATGKFHKAAERFLNPVHGLVQQSLEDKPPPKPSMEQDRSVPMEKDWTNTYREASRMIAGASNRTELEGVWNAIAESWKKNEVIQQKFKDAQLKLG
tara:strand:- start:409 stop:1242 length:834 start_codon:yes stop_codon:yes gene_type:complete